MTEKKSGALVNIEEAQQLMDRGENAELWPQDLKPQEKKQLAYIACQYGLDPFFSDLTVLGGNPYVTASGLKRNAHESDDPPASIQLEKQESEGPRHFEYKALLWKKSTPEDRPFVEYGEASPDDCNSQISQTDKDLKAMARTRAVNRVIRLAYNINLTSAEELSGYDPDSRQIKDVTPAQNGNEKSQKKQTKSEPQAMNEELLQEIYGLLERKQANEKSIDNWLKDTFGIAIAQLMDPKHEKIARKVIDILEKRPDAEPEEQDAEISDAEIEEIQQEIDENDPFAEEEKTA